MPITGLKITDIKKANMPPSFLDFPQTPMAMAGAIHRMETIIKIIRSSALPGIPIKKIEL